MRVSPVRLGAVFTHPIQYNSPLFRQLAMRPEVRVTVMYCQQPSRQEQGVGFGEPFEWDVDLLSGYTYTWLKNVAPRPDSQRFTGCNTPEIIRRIRQKEFDVVWVQGWNALSLWQAMIACWLSGTPVITRPENHLGSDTASWKRWVKKRLYPLFIRRFAVCLAIGTWSEQYFRHYGAQTVVRAPYCVDNVWFASRADEERRCRQGHRCRWRIPEDSVVFLFAGKFEAKKRPFDLLEAVSRLSEQTRSKVSVLMVGDGALRAECETYAAERQLPVTFAGFLNQGEMPAAYAAADCLVLPSDGRETWGLVVNEAMASGITAIVSDKVGCSVDLILDGQTGLQFEMGNTESLARCIETLIRDRLLLEKMKRNARSHIQHYSICNAVDGIIRGVESLAADPGAAP